jgi:hypothetical protein
LKPDQNEALKGVVVKSTKCKRNHKSVVLRVDMLVQELVDLEALGMEVTLLEVQ